MSPCPTTTILRRQIVTIAIVTLLFSTLFLEINADKKKKKLKKYSKYLAAVFMLAQQIKPKKSFKLVPVPVPIPIPIEWEQPPIVINKGY